MAVNEISVAQGEDKTLKLEVTDDDDVIFNLTGHSLTFTVKYNENESANIVLKISSDINQIDIFDPVAGEANIFLVPADTEDFEPGDYFYDIWVTLSTGERFTVIKKNNFKITPRITVL